MSTPRVRFAPSPTGRLHIGSLRSALFNYLFARHTGGTFILRVEDTDQKRTVPGALEDIVDTLAAYGLTADEGLCRQDGQLVERGEYGPYTQSKRLEKYTQAVHQLVEQGSAYACFCTAERLAALRQSQEAQHLAPGYDGLCRTLEAPAVAQRIAAGEQHVIRFRTPREGQTSAEDIVRGHVTFKHSTLEDTVLLKSDGYPTYHLANVVDDHAMAITHVIRAEEWLPSLPLHLLLYDAFKWSPPQFAHIPLILGATRKKLSKRDGDAAAADYLREYLPSAVLNFIALLGWNPKTTKEYYATLPELATDFSLENVNRAGAIFSVEKLQHLNRLHLRAADPVALTKILNLPIAAPDAQRWVPIAVERVTTFSELRSSLELFLHEPTYDGKLLVPKQGSAVQTVDILQQTHQWLAALPATAWESAASLKTPALAWILERQWTNQQALWPLRVALSGAPTSPDVFVLATALGKERTLTRLQYAEKLLQT